MYFPQFNDLLHIQTIFLLHAALPCLSLLSGMTPDLFSLSEISL